MANTKRRRKNYQKISKLFGIILIIMIGLFGAGFLKSIYQNHQLNGNQQVTQVNQEQVEQRRFINTIAPDSKQLYNQFHVLPSITIAQAILESDWGKSELASKYYNLFGVKAQDNNWVFLNTQEYVNGEFITVKSRFQVYNSWSESLRDHAALLAGGTKWNANQYADVINASDFKQAANGLMIDGYATDPTYSQKLIQIIQKYQLYHYDN